ncbi:MFS transporter [Streptomyces sp. NPDC021100]|uniref:MFS transporter n=1 Tax=Streptomyces sp. NPDC021100 TaxID=3365114 RepID=UPI00379F95B8
MTTATATAELSIPAATARYRDILTAPYVTRLLTGAVIGHLPVAMAPLAILLTVRAGHGSLAQAGTLAAVYGLTTALGQPLLGRLLDRRGHTLTLTLTILLSTTAFTGLALIHPADQPTTATLLATLAGLATPPLEAALRVLWPRLLHADSERRAALALDGCAQELVFIVGPLLVLLLDLAAGSTMVLATTALTGLAGTALFLTADPARTWKPTPTATHRRSPLKAPGPRALAIAFLGTGMALGSLNVVALTAAECHHAPYLSTLIPAALAVGSLTGGLLYGRRQWPGTPPVQLLCASGALFLALLPQTANPDPLWAVAAAAVPGLVLAPSLITAFTLLGDLTPPGTLGEASAWLIACLGLGQSAGTAFAGAAGTRGPAAAALIAMTGAAFACAVLAATRRRLNPSAAPTPVPLSPPR